MLPRKSWSAKEYPSNIEGWDTHKRLEYIFISFKCEALFHCPFLFQRQLLPKCNVHSRYHDITIHICEYSFQISRNPFQFLIVYTLFWLIVLHNRILWIMRAYGLKHPVIRKGSSNVVDTVVSTTKNAKDKDKQNLTMSKGLFFDYIREFERIKMSMLMNWFGQWSRRLTLGDQSLSHDFEVKIKVKWGKQLIKVKGY